MNNNTPLTAYSLGIMDEEIDNTPKDIELWDHSEREVDDYSDVNLRHYLVKF